MNLDRTANHAVEKGIEFQFRVIQIFAVVPVASLSVGSPMTFESTLLEYSKKPMYKRGSINGHGNLVDPRVKFNKNGNAIAAIQIMEFHTNSRFFSALVMGHLFVDFASVGELFERRTFQLTAGALAVRIACLVRHSLNYDTT